MAPPQNQWPNYEEKPHMHTESNHSSIAIQVRNNGFTKFSQFSKGYGTWFGRIKRAMAVHLFL